MNYFFLKHKRDISLFEIHANQKMFKCGSDENNANYVFNLSSK